VKARYAPNKILEGNTVKGVCPKGGIRKYKGRRH
jgi:hypothetical protein